ncbi:unnamed protein product [Brassica rapa]|uniref:Protein kinase domain-containing protein n=1 Tax=Brassica campestris TaxID=3711 RepID=A0A3P6C222_BRACM|nr:unnamed protein product [Brassica rapa]VDD01929.1 unnamed protein product [Brassica rapa]
MSSMQGARERGIERNVRIREAETYLNINGEEAETETKREFAKKVIFVKEYGQAWVATLRGDVYSFGVVMFEILTGKRPMEVFRPKMSREIVAWVHQMRREEKPEEVFDPLLRKSGQEKEMLRVLDIACMCVNQNPMKRPVIQQVVD